MTELSMDTARMLDMLPESEQVLAHEFVKRLVLAWDPDFTKVTPEEARQMEAAEQSGFLDESEIDWEHLDRMV